MWKVLTLNSVSGLHYHWLVPWRGPEGGYKEAEDRGSGSGEGGRK